MKSNSKTWDDFMSSAFVTKALEKTAQAEGNEYSVTPASSTELGKSVTTQGVSAGGASMTGGAEDSKALYTTSPAALAGNAEQYADATVEGLEDVAKAMMDVAMSTPTGEVKEAGSRKSIKTAQDMGEFSDDDYLDDLFKADLSDEDVTQTDDEYLTSLEDEALSGPISSEEETEAFSSEPTIEDSSDTDLAEMFEKDEASDEFSFDDFSTASAEKRKTFATLIELVKVADECDALGLHNDANDVDSVIKDEIKSLITAAKKKCDCKSPKACKDPKCKSKCKKCCKKCSKKK